ncbi:hypothetical protein [Streptomyces sp. BA2]|nr:hypothetical protein [Streptomyces sp. BA2]
MVQQGGLPRAGFRLDEQVRAGGAVAQDVLQEPRRAGVLGRV